MKKKAWTKLVLGSALWLNPFSNDLPAPQTGPVKSAYSSLYAGQYDQANGVEKWNSQIVNSFDEGDDIEYSQVDFENGADFFNVSISVAPGYEGKNIEIHLDSPQSPPIGVLKTISTGSWSQFQVLTTPVQKIAGVHDLYLVGSGGGGIANIFSLMFTRQNASSAGSNSGATPSSPGTAGSIAPLGGPGGYINMVMNDSFGSAKPGANITSVSQFDPKTPYGLNGTGWDGHMRAWDSGQANIYMAPDHLEIYPTNSAKSGFISSHFEFLPQGSQRIYYEMRLSTGRGDYGGQSWPAVWLFAGNEPGMKNAESEFDIMETYMTQQWGPYDANAGGWAQHFVVTSHPNSKSDLESVNVNTPGIDITTTPNVYGCEVYRGADNNLYFNVYFNGKLVVSTKEGLPWNSTPASLFFGWNPKSSAYPDQAVMKLDYVKAWIK